MVILPSDIRMSTLQLPPDSLIASRSHPRDICASMEQNKKHLPKELVDKILDIVIKKYDHDPAYQWSVLRHISSRHMHLIEQFSRISGFQSSPSLRTMDRGNRSTTIWSKYQTLR